VDKALYRELNRVERFFNILKQFCRIATATTSSAPTSSFSSISPPCEFGSDQSPRLGHAQEYRSIGMAE